VADVGRAQQRDLHDQQKAVWSVAFGRGRQSLEHSFWYTGGLLTLLATDENTNGQFALQEQVGRKGNVPSPHIHHREDETFYVLEGEMTFSVGDQTIKATPGTTVFAPRDVVHSFTIDSEQVRILVMNSPDGLRVRFTQALSGRPRPTAHKLCVSNLARKLSRAR
jgi:quercetin dioxygenase-like cupin family protein